MSKLYICDTNFFKDSEQFNTGILLLPRAEQERINSINNTEAKKASLTAWLLLRYAFYEEKALPLFYDIKRESKGRPYLDNNDFYFNLSHSGKYCISLFSHVRVGCDIEKKREALPAVTKRFFTESENDFFQGMPTDKKNDYFFTLFTAKESIVKWLGKGISYPFSGIEAMDGKKPRDSIILEGKQLFLSPMTLDHHYISLCSEKKEIITPEILSGNILTKY